jgi:AcrR family transcriptional regulator
VTRAHRTRNGITVPSTEPPTPGTTRPGGRTARTRAAVRDATVAELADRGYAALTVDGVAARSGVHRATLYRRWGGVDGLVADALELAGEDGWQPPDTGTLEGDLLGLAHEVLRAFTGSGHGGAPAAFVAAAFHSEPTARALRAFFAGRHERAAAVVRRAVERGELSPDTDPGALVRAAVAPLYYRLFISREPIDEVAAEQAARAALSAARAGVFRRTTRAD